MRDGPTLWSADCAGDKEGADVRRVMEGRSKCQPGSWSAPVLDDNGDIYVGSQVGTLQRWGNRDDEDGIKGMELLSSLSTGVAFQDNAISISDGMMAVTTCNALIVFKTHDDSFAADNVFDYHVPGLVVDGKVIEAEDSY